MLLFISLPHILAPITALIALKMLPLSDVLFISLKCISGKLFLASICSLAMDRNLSSA